MTAQFRRGARRKRLSPLEVLGDKVHALGDAFTAAGVANTRREDAACAARSALLLPRGTHRRRRALRRYRLAVQRAESARLRLKHAAESLVLLLDRRSRLESERAASAAG